MDASQGVSCTHNQSPHSKLGGMKEGSLPNAAINEAMREHQQRHDRRQRRGLNRPEVQSFVPRHGHASLLSSDTVAHVQDLINWKLVFRGRRRLLLTLVVRSRHNLEDGSAYYSTTTTTTTTTTTYDLGLVPTAAQYTLDSCYLYVVHRTRHKQIYSHSWTS